VAKLTPGIGWSEARGSVGSVTYCRSSAGMTFRRRSNGPSRQTARSLLQASRLSSESARWRELTEDQRRQWSAAAEADAVPGYKSGLSGHALFCAVNVSLRDANQARVLVPSVTRVGEFLALETPIQSGTTSSFRLQWTRTLAAGQFGVIRATSPAPPYLSETRNPTYRFLGAISQSPLDLTVGLWGTAWWSGLAAYSGQAITWEFRVLTNTGARGPVYRRTTILT
jgi:hypothetical protein